VIPVHRNGEVFAVLDIDSPVKDRFGEKDKKGLEQIVKCIEEGLT
jgi:GAF domain-containing protein